MTFRFSHGDEDALPVNAEINVTPFIDVMLVLLIIFMVAAPLATVDVKVDLPVASAIPAPQPDQPLTLSLRGDGVAFVNDRAVPMDQLGAALHAASAGVAPQDQRVLLRADKGLAYARVMEAMNALRAAGYLKVALVGLDAGAGQ